MDPPVLTATAADPYPNSSANAKIRLLCSYGGHIVPRPHDKSLCYSGGDTRIVAVHRRTNASSFSSFASHLSRTLYGSTRPFTLKYQLPNEDLDSLISVTTDEDLHNMIEEHDRISSSPTPSRIRLFLFPSKPESVGSVLLGPKSESWFCDALKSTNLMRRGQGADSGLANGLMDCAPPVGDPPVEAQNESLSGNGGCSEVATKQGQVPESIVLETSSSFGSTGSSISMSKSPAIGVHGDDEKRVRLPSSGSVERFDGDNVTPNDMPRQYAMIYKDPAVHLTSMETKVCPIGVEPVGVVHNPAHGFQVLETVQVGAHQLPDQSQHQQELQHVQAGPHYMPQPLAAPPSYHPMYYLPLNQQHAHAPYRQNNPYPVYYMPMRPAQPYNTCVQYNLVDTSMNVPPHSQVHPPAPAITPPAANKEAAASAPLVEVPSDQNLQQLVDLSDADPTTTHSTVSSEFDDDFAYAQIYKTQPSGPTLISQYQTMTSAGTVLLSEALKHPNADVVNN